MEYVIPLPPRKRMKIYYRTKNRRIKRKQEKKEPLIKVQNEIAKYINYNLKQQPMKIYINGKEINNENS